MRLKFRAWDKDAGKMLFFSSIFNHRPFTELSTFAQYESFPKYHELEIMQFTGLQDKRGKDVYEGDIIREGGRIVCIRYSEKYARFEYTIPTGIAGLYGFYGEVIGNIKDNPELLEA